MGLSPLQIWMIVSLLFGFMTLLSVGALVHMLFTDRVRSGKQDKAVRELTDEVHAHERARAAVYSAVIEGSKEYAVMYHRCIPEHMVELRQETAVIILRAFYGTEDFDELVEIFTANGGLPEGYMNAMTTETANAVPTN